MNPRAKVWSHVADAMKHAEGEYALAFSAGMETDDPVSSYRRAFYALAQGWIDEYTRAPVELYTVAELDLHTAYFDAVAHALRRYEAIGEWTQPFAWPREIRIDA